MSKPLKIVLSIAMTVGVLASATTAPDVTASIALIAAGCYVMYQLIDSFLPN
jgi:hypothetical protein